MSYSLQIQPLVIEDEPGPKSAYDRIFRKIASESPWSFFSLAPPCFAFSFQEAERFLSGSKPFHIVILDLQLPERRGLPTGTIELGLTLLNQCIARERFPIPAVLIISGHVGRTQQDKIQDELRSAFFHGRMFAKGDLAMLETEIRRACHEALRYCAVGVHLRDAFDKELPTISPAEDDLLRRSVLASNGVTGVDLSWWSAEKFSTLGGSAEWTKVLLGRHLLVQGRGASRPRFFKFFPASLAPQVSESARQIEHKLSHIKVVGSISGRSRALIVTEKVGERDTRPISLGEYFSRLQSEKETKVRLIAAHVIQQLEALGDSNPQSCQLRELLWASHNLEDLAEQFKRFAVNESSAHETLDPVSLLSVLLQRDEIVQYDERTLIHGDMHLNNVAVDLDPDTDEADAYIFDAACTVGRAPIEKDLASLEIALLMHRNWPQQALPVMLGSLYGDGFLTSGRDASGIDFNITNTIAFVTYIRMVVAERFNAQLYALMVFDCAMVQIGGLAYGISNNKIQDPLSAVTIATSASLWYQRNNPQ